TADCGHREYVRRSSQVDWAGRMSLLLSKDDIAKRLRYAISDAPWRGRSEQGKSSACETFKYLGALPSSRLTAWPPPLRRLPVSRQSMCSNPVAMPLTRQSWPQPCCA